MTILDLNFEFKLNGNMKPEFNRNGNPNLIGMTIPTNTPGHTVILMIIIIFEITKSFLA